MIERPTLRGLHCGRARQVARAWPAWLSLWAGACAEPSAPPSVLLVVADTVRADKLGTYGGEGGVTPFLDRVAERGLVFEHASAHAPWTLPSVATLLTSQHPRQHGAGGNVPRRGPRGAEGGFTALADSSVTLAQVFADAGWRTASIVNVDFLGETFGLTRGFQDVDAKSYQNNVQVRPASETTDAALAWLDRSGGEPFFLLVHYFDPHAVYDPPQPFRRRFAAPEDQSDETFVFGTREHMIRLRSDSLPLEPTVLERAERLYDGEIAYVDAEVARLLAGLESRGLAETTVFVFTSDHGEEFLDHGGFEHGHTLYTELLHVPLILAGPGVPQGERDPRSVGLIDVAPTITGLVGLDAPETFSGRSLLDGGGARASDPRRPVFAHGNFWGPPLTSVRTEGEKLILGPEGGGAELYLWRQDPLERRDVGRARPETLARMRGLASAMAEALDAGEGRPVDVDRALRDHLRGLGYVGEQGQGE